MGIPIGLLQIHKIAFDWFILSTAIGHQKRGKQSEDGRDWEKCINFRISGWEGLKSMYQLGPVSNSDSDDECGSEKKEGELQPSKSGSRVRRPKASISKYALGLNKNYVHHFFLCLI